MAEPRVAILIDADNVSGDHASRVVEEAGHYGRVVIRRIFGDWTATAGRKWKAVLADLSIHPIQQFANTVGKNATDSALIIDAMDLLHHDSAEVFCIVSSDADFTRLAARLRESAKIVVGIGARKTPKAFVNACDKFTFLENLDRSGKRASSGAKKDEPAVNVAQDPALRALLERAYEDAETDQGFASLSAMGTILNKLDPAFDPRTYGSRQLRTLVDKQPWLEVGTHPDPQRKSLVVRRTNNS